MPTETPRYSKPQVRKVIAVLQDWADAAQEMLDDATSNARVDTLDERQSALLDAIDALSMLTYD